MNHIYQYDDKRLVANYLELVDKAALDNLPYVIWELVRREYYDKAVFAYQQANQG